MITTRLFRTPFTSLTLAASLLIAAAPFTTTTLLAQNGEQAETPAEKPAYPPLSEVTEGLEEIPGLMTLYRPHGDDPKQDHTKLLCRIPASLLGEDLLFATSISRGSMAGFMWRDWLVRWERVGKHVKLVVPNVRYVQTPGTPVNDAIERTYRPSFIAALPIITMAGNDPVVDLGGLIFSNIARPPRPMGASGNPNRALSVLRKAKNFPENILIDVDLAMSSAFGGESVGVSYAFRKLPALGSYTPRPADERVGYFVTSRQDWSTSYSARETAIRYANRWKLQKQDPSLELSPPKEPIVFIIEKTVPIRWRRWVRAGIEDWNKAFEQIGYVDAIVVQQQTDTNEFANIDPEDARYNFLRWIVSGRAFAMGPSVADPRTGQILDADIIFDDSMIRWFTTEFDQLGPQSLSNWRGPAYDKYTQIMQHVTEQGHIDEETYEQISALAAPCDHSRDGATCELAHGLQQQMAMGLMLSRLGTPSGKEVPEQFIGQIIQMITAHEVGHTLGLRHNFRASGWLSLDEIRQRRDLTNEPTSASVMDYNPILFFEGDDFDEVKTFTTPDLGPYDHWAIEYGYGEPAPGQSLQDYLAEVGSRSTQPELAYATDEDTMWIYSPDPLTNRWDMSNDPEAWLETRGELADELLENVTEWAIDPDEPRYFLRNMFAALLFEKTQPGMFVSRIVGGQHYSRSRLGDPDAPPALDPLDAEEMRSAMQTLAKTIFNPDYYPLDAELLNNLAPSRWRGEGALMLDYPIHTVITRAQARALQDLMAYPLIQRIYDAEVKVEADDKYTAAEHLKTLTDIVWSDLKQAPAGPYSDASPMIPSITRNLQSAHVATLMDYVRIDLGLSRFMSPDVQRMMRHNLRNLAADIESTLEANPNLDFATEAHLTETHSQITRALEAEFSAR
ncbi:zinc-dependent metalloprotease [Mucisphaera sp.]|uniref:zinc-dependent metalloprotease n=1 Tax=Mucisphaera sp. TaxID=2913024 RepID=UPI003D1425E7